MKKVIIYNDRWCSGGVESMIVNLLLNFDFSDLDITLLVGQKETDIYDCFLTENRIKMVLVLRKPMHDPIKRNLKIIKKLKLIIKEIKPDVMHINVCNSIGFKYAKIAKKVCNCKTIVHSHNTKIEHDVLGVKKIAHKYYKKYEKFSDSNIACSNLAGRFLFKKDFLVLKNGVDLNRFRYNQEARLKGRSELDFAETDTVLLNIGRFSNQKNQKFLLNILYQLPSNYKLLIVGEGTLKVDFSHQAKKLELQERLIILNPRKNIEILYSIADIFCLPSLHEGLPVVGVEAQANGMKCIFSNTITGELGLSEHVTFLSLGDPKKWIEHVKTLSTERYHSEKIIKDSGYDIRDSSRVLHSIYIK